MAFLSKKECLTSRKHNFSTFLNNFLFFFSLEKANFAPSLPKHTPTIMMKHIFFVTVLLIAAVNFSLAHSIQPPQKTALAEDTHLLLAHKWKKGNFFLDLKINGKFEAKINGEDMIYGFWEVSKDQKTLTLTNDYESDDEFVIKYTLSNLSFHSMKLVDKNGKATYLDLAD